MHKARDFKHTFAAEHDFGFGPYRHRNSDQLYFVCFLSQKSTNICTCCTWNDICCIIGHVLHYQLYTQMEKKVLTRHPWELNPVLHIWWLKEFTISMSQTNSWLGTILILFLFYYLHISGIRGTRTHTERFQHNLRPPFFTSWCRESCQQVALYLEAVAVQRCEWKTWWWKRQWATCIYLTGPN